MILVFRAKSQNNEKSNTELELFELSDLVMVGVHYVDLKTCRVRSKLGLDPSSLWRTTNEAFLQITFRYLAQ